MNWMQSQRQLNKALDASSLQRIELTKKDEEIAKLKEEIKILYENIKQMEQDFFLRNLLT